MGGPGEGETSEPAGWVKTRVVFVWPVLLGSTDVLYCGSLTFLTLAYVTYQDLRQDHSLKDQTVIVIRAPPETKLEVPDPQEVCPDKFCVFVRVP